MMLGIPGQHQRNPPLTGHLRASHDNRDEACSYTPTFTVAICHRGPGQVMVYPEHCCMTLIPHTSSPNMGIFVNIFTFLRSRALNINILCTLFFGMSRYNDILKYLAVVFAIGSVSIYHLTSIKYVISYQTSDNQKYHNVVQKQVDLWRAQQTII